MSELRGQVLWALGFAGLGVLSERSPPPPSQSGGQFRTTRIAAENRAPLNVRWEHLHIDFDAFAPELAPGVADEPVPGGLTLEEATTIIRATAERFHIMAATLATYAPNRDRDNRTSQFALSLLDLLAEYARSPGLSQGRTR
jgi:Arginase family